ncbi:hypothetical protein Ssi02_58000 [Sinosporangium siamense]|uniref:Phage integrase family protein n=1 Tax=Sinosporangium siamense TaxID=1367973 RepID=A0A919VEX5_9ACTN|nr:hypothetical protein Ssi02_58000 [Sinosporangium siamense]
MLEQRIELLPPKALIFTGARSGILNSSGRHQTHWRKVVRLAREHEVATRTPLHKLRHAHAVDLLGSLSLDTVSKRPPERRRGDGGTDRGG